jgi:hypothetical protein
MYARKAFLWQSCPKRREQLRHPCLLSLCVTLQHVVRQQRLCPKPGCKAAFVITNIIHTSTFAVSSGAGGLCVLLTVLKMPLLLVVGLLLMWRR